MPLGAVGDAIRALVNGIVELDLKAIDIAQRGGAVRLRSLYAGMQRFDVIGEFLVRHCSVSVTEGQTVVMRWPFQGGVMANIPDDGPRRFHGGGRTDLSESVRTSGQAGPSLGPTRRRWRSERSAPPRRLTRTRSAYLLPSSPARYPRTPHTSRAMRLARPKPNHRRKRRRIARSLRSACASGPSHGKTVASLSIGKPASTRARSSTLLLASRSAADCLALVDVICGAGSRQSGANV